MILSQHKTEKPENTDGTMHLLLVDDDDIAVLNYRRIADSSGLFSSIRSATNGLNALDMLNQSAEGIFPFPDVILLDLDMPVMNGITFLKVLKKWDVPRKEDISIIVIMDPESESRREVLKELGIKHFLNKPVSFEALTEALREIEDIKV